MPKHPHNTIAQQLNHAQVAVSNTLSDAEILGLVAAFGYAAPKMKEGKDNNSAAQTAMNAQISVHLGSGRQMSLF